MWRWPYWHDRRTGTGKAAKKLICYYAFSFHSMNFPLLAAIAATVLLSVCDSVILDPCSSLLLCSKTMPSWSLSNNHTSQEPWGFDIMCRCVSRLLSVTPAGAAPPLTQQPLKHSAVYSLLISSVCPSIPFKPRWNINNQRMVKIFTSSRKWKPQPRQLKIQVFKVLRMYKLFTT